MATDGNMAIPTEKNMSRITNMLNLIHLSENAKKILEITSNEYLGIFAKGAMSKKENEEYGNQWKHGHVHCK